MDAKTHQVKVARAKAKRVATTLMFAATSAATLWLAYLLFSSADCGQSGSRLAWAIAGLCAIMGSNAVAVMLLVVGAVAGWLAWTSGNPTTRSSRTRA